MDLAQLESRLRDFFSHDDHGAICVYLFGSHARGTERQDSDVDLGVLFATEPLPTFDDLPLDLEAQLEKAVEKPVQIVVLNTAPADLVHRVLRDGRLILDSDPSRRIRFEVRRRNEYFDLEPIRHTYRYPQTKREPERREP